MLLGRDTVLLSLISSHLPPGLHSPRNLAAVAVGAAALAGIAWYALRRPRPSADEIERLRTTLRNIVAIDEHRSGELRDAFDMAREALKG